MGKSFNLLNNVNLESSSVIYHRTNINGSVDRVRLNELLDAMLGYKDTCTTAMNDWNDLPDKTGFFMGSNMNNRPNGNTVANWWFVIQLVHNSNYKKQLAFSFNTTEIYQRTCSQGNWGSWSRII